LSSAFKQGSGIALACALSVCVLLPAAALALDPRKAITQYVHDVWTTEDGLPQNSILSIAQTRDGYLWVGTWGGLARFDGVRFTVFDRGNTPALKNNYIYALYEDREGSLWIGTGGGGLTRLRDGKFIMGIDRGTSGALQIMVCSTVLRMEYLRTMARKRIGLPNRWYRFMKTGMGIFG
jgi:ligand-binding sensor domain-containing protein